MGLELNQKLEWSSSLSIGVTRIDKQHQELFILTNFINTVEYLKNEFNSKGVTLDLVFRVQSQVVGWLINHVIKEDKKIGNWLENQS